MAKSNIQNITTTQTFQNWFDKTNEMVDLFKSSTLTASVTGDTTIGNAILEGNFTAEIVAADTQIQTDSIIAFTGGEAVSFGSHINVVSPSDKVVATFNYGASGGQARFTDGTNSWDMGIQDSTSRNFIINTGIADPNKLVLTPAGELTVPNLVTIEDVTVGGTLSVSGNLNINDLFANNVFATGELTTAYSASDLKLKENLNVIEDALDKVEKINGYTFNYIGKDDIATGVVAQEVEKVLPGIVYDVSDETGTFKAVRYGNIVGLLIEAIKELKDEIERLKDGSSN